MKRLVLFATVQMLLGAAWAQGQKSPVMVRFDANPCGRFYVDGQLFDKSATFVWALYSTHIYQEVLSYPISTDIWCVSGNGTGPVPAPPQAGLGPEHQVFVSDAYVSDTRVPTQICVTFPNTPGCDLGPQVVIYTYCITGSPDANGQCAAGVPYTAPVIRLLSEYLYRVAVDLNAPWKTPVTPPARCPATCYGVSVGGTCFSKSGLLWFPAGSEVVVEASPAPGFAWISWIGDLKGFGDGPLVAIVNLDRPLVIRPFFWWATAIRIQTDPPGMPVMVDRTIVTEAPCSTDHSLTFYWAQGSQHALSPVSPYMGPHGELWAFYSWSDGADENRILTVPGNSSAAGADINLTLKYGQGVRVSFGTSPTGLKLVIDGRSSWPYYSFVWAIGSKHTISAPLQQAMKGRQYVFNHWANGGPADQEFTVVAADQMPRTGAYYDVLGQLRVESVPSGLSLAVDGAPCVTPCTIDRPAGTVVKVSAPASVRVDDATRLDFRGWADGGTGERSWTASTSADVLKANYTTSYRVQVASNPTGAANFTFDPPSPDGFYPAGTTLTVTAQANPGYHFKFWQSEDLQSPLAATQVLFIGGPLTLQAAFEEIAFVNNVGNAAGPTPDAVVAPGSVIAINGHKLAQAAETGPANPLAQAIGGVTVQVDDRLLPLFSVAPQQIQAQLPSGLAEGEHTLAVHQNGEADVSARFTVRRNAPGLFNTTAADKSFALALHADGTAVTTDSPAQHGETITLLGTGFGPYHTAPLDGFVLPEGFNLPLVDPVEIRVGDSTVLQPVSVKAAVGYVGYTAVQLKITGDLPADATVELRAAVKDPSDPEGKTFRESNKVLLPVK